MRMRQSPQHKRTPRGYHGRAGHFLLRSQRLRRCSSFVGAQTPDHPYLALNAQLFHDAKEAVRLREEFLSIASRKIRTPMTMEQYARCGCRFGERLNLYKPEANSANAALSGSQSRVRVKMDRLTTTVLSLAVLPPAAQAGATPSTPVRVNVGRARSDLGGGEPFDCAQGRLMCPLHSRRL